MTARYQWVNAEHTALARVVGRHFVLIQQESPEWVAAQGIAVSFLDAAQEATQEARASMIASRRQVRLALGEAGCAAMDAAANDQELPWAMREQIRSSHEWHRSAPEIDEFAWLLGLDANAVDTLFAKAMSL
jgi:hypothetical protein